MTALAFVIRLHRYRAVGDHIHVGMSMDGTPTTMSWLDLGPVAGFGLSEDLLAADVADILNHAIDQGRPVE